MRLKSETLLFVGKSFFQKKTNNMDNKKYM